MRYDDDIDFPAFTISVAAELAGMHPQTLRMYERRGLLRPSRTAKNTRRYSLRDVQRLVEIQALTQLGLNLAGVEQVLALHAQVEEMTHELERLQGMLEEAAATMRREVARVQREHRAELVPVVHGQIVPLGRRRRRA